jgi:pyoverdine/dityrosine biosynthesis protein Dit1
MKHIIKLLSFMLFASSLHAMAPEPNIADKQGKGMQIPIPKQLVHADTPEMLLGEYTAALPKIDTTSDKSTQAKIVDFLTKFNSGEIKSGVDILTQKVEKRIAAKKPIDFLLIGFPSKCPNVKKVLAPEFDFGDFVGLHTLNHMANQIRSVYEHGGNISLYTREPQMDDVNALTTSELGFAAFPDSVRAKYQKQLKHAVSTAGLTAITLKHINNVDQIYNTACETARDEEKQTSVSKEKELDGMKTFWKNEFKGLETAVQAKHGLKSKTQTNKFLANIAEQTAQKMFTGAKVMREVLKKHVPEYESHIRLSVRAPEDGNIANKLGVNLIYGSHGTPWLNVLVGYPAERGVKVFALMAREKQLKTMPHAFEANHQIGNMSLGYVQCSPSKEPTKPTAKISDLD